MYPGVKKAFIDYPNCTLQYATLNKKEPDILTVWFKMNTGYEPDIYLAVKVNIKMRMVVKTGWFP
jgi:hypothetical protein